MKGAFLKDRSLVGFISMMAVISAVAVCAAAVMTADVSYAGDSGTCGDGLVWVYDGSDRSLTISGSGEMKDYGQRQAPWYGYSRDIAELVLPYGLTHIGGQAFYGLLSLNGVTIPETVESIGEGAFSYCRALTSLHIPDSVLTIGDFAFYGCSALDSAAISGSVTEIGYRMFSSCLSLSSVVIPGHVQVIGPDAFSGCKRLASVTVSGSVKEIGEGAFSDCPVETVYNYSSLRFGAYDYGLPGYTVVYSERCGDDLFWVYAESDRTLKIGGRGAMDDFQESCAPWCGLCDSITGILLPDGITGIGSYAFSGIANMKSVQIPGSVKTMGRGVFYQCSSLTSADIPAGVAAIDDYTFYGCTSLASVNIPDGVAAIGGGAFSYCRALTSVSLPDSVKEIGGGAFSFCAALVRVDIPCSVTEIGEGAFSGCSPLAVYINSGIAVDHVLLGLSADVDIYHGLGGDMFWKFTEKDRTLTVVGTGGIGDFADAGTPWYSYIGTIEHIELPAGLTRIGDFAFCGCTEVASVVIPHSTAAIGTSAFSGCRGLESVAMPSSLTAIGAEAFCGCVSLTSVTVYRVSGTADSASFGYVTPDSVHIPDSVTEIGEKAFSGCTGLNSVCISRSVKTIGANAFEGCGIGQVFNGSSLSIDKGQYGLPKGVRIFNSICGEDLTWEYDENSRTLVISGTGAMYYPPINSIMCPPWSDLDVEIEAVVLPQGLTSIYRFAFSHCSLVSVTIPDTVRSIGDHAFSACRKLTSLELPDSITTIGFEAFYCCESLKTINIPCNVTEIGNRAFNDCYELIEIYNCSAIKVAYNKNYNQYGVPKNASVITDRCGDGLAWKFGDGTLTVSGHGAMNDYKEGKAPWYDMRNDIGNVVLPEGLTHIGNYAFCGLSGLNSVRIPETVESVGKGAFSCCGSLSSVSIPDSVTEIGDRAFDLCSKLERIDVGAGNGRFSSENGVLYDKDGTALIQCPMGIRASFLAIPGSVRTICDRAFWGCGSLVCVDVPCSVETIGDHAFCSCISLSSVTLGSAETIGDYAFSGCKLTVVCIPASAVKIGVGTFDQCPIDKVYNYSAALNIKPGDHGLSSGVSVESGRIGTVSVHFRNGDTELCTIAETAGRFYVLPDVPERAGYEFVGWYNPRNGEVSGSTLVTPDDDTILCAVWMPL